MQHTGQARLSTGISGLDEILQGGLVDGRAYLISGPPGGGKTTLGWHFLTAGLESDEPALFITLGESESALRSNAASLGFSSDAVEVLDLSPSSENFEEVRSYDIFSAAEVELQPLTAKIMATIERVKPKRVFIDSVTSLRYLARDAFDYRRQTTAFLRFLTSRGSCVLLTSEHSREAPDDDLRFLCDGVIEVAPSERARQISVSKFRGSGFREGTHTLRLSERGASVYPRLIPEQHGIAYNAESLSWGVQELDDMMHGGIERGTITLITGPSGVGKTTLGVQFMKEVAKRGERSIIYSFDEPVSGLLQRCEQVNIPVREMVERGTLEVVNIEPLRYSADEFANMVRRDVEEHGTRVVMLDSISGYRLSVSANELTERIHALGRYLQNVGVTLLLVNELLTVVDFRISEIGISYLADNVVFLRYMEKQRNGLAEMMRSVGVLKKRLSDFDKSVREYELTPEGLRIGEKLQHLGGLLGNAPHQDSTRQNGAR